MFMAQNEKYSQVKVGKEKLKKNTDLLSEKITIFEFKRKLLHVHKTL